MVNERRRRKQYKKHLTEIKKVSPVACEFGLGDRVMFTNDFGAVFGPYKVVGFDEDDSFYGKFIYLDKECFWVSVRPESLTMVEKSRRPK